VILRRGSRRGVAGIGDPFTLGTVLSSPAVQQAATQTAGNALQAIGQGLLSIFGDDPPPPPPQPVAPPPRPGIPMPLVIGGLGLAGVAAYLLLRK